MTHQADTAPPPPSDGVAHSGEDGPTLLERAGFDVADPIGHDAMARRMNI